MNRFKCSSNPFTCDHSEFLEDSEKSEWKIRRWIECVDYYHAEDPETKEMRCFQCEEFTLVEDGIETVVKKGDLCVNNPPDWWIIIGVSSYYK